MKTHSEFFKRLFSFGLLLFLALNSCTDGSSIVDTRSEAESTNAPPCNYEQYNQYGTQFYEHVKYNMAMPAENLLPIEYREEFKNTFDSLSNMMNGWTLTQVLDYVETEGIFSTEVRVNIDELEHIISELASGTENFEDTKLAIENLTDTKTNDPNISCIDKNTIVGYNSIYLNALNYLDEIGWITPGQNILGDYAQNRGCGFWDVIGCIFSAGEGFGWGTVVGGAAGFIVGFAFIQVGGPAYGLVIGAAIGAGYGVYLGLKGCCPDDLDCHTVMSLSLAFASCNSVATYTAFGFGSDDVSLTWANSGGTPAAAITLLPAASVAITQNSTNTPVSTTITSTCSDNSTRTSDPFIRDLAQLVKQVVNVSLGGPSEVVPASGLTYNYVGFGIAANSNYSTQWEITNGTVVSSSIDEVSVIWNQNMAIGEVKLIVTNNCPGGEMRQFILTVIGEGDEP